MILRRQPVLIALLAVAAAGVVALSTVPAQMTSTAGETLVTIGRSAKGRPIRATVLGDPDAPRKVLVIGVIHGDEPAGAKIVDALARPPEVPGTTLWLVRNLNPDGAARHTRQNGRGVDLNRNFPWRWRRDGQPFDQEYSGPKALSEPESRAAHHLIAKLKPAITIWFHQPLGLVDLSGGDARIERRFARLTGLPARRLTRYHGSATSWQNHRLKATTAFVTELPAGRLTAAGAARYAAAVRELIPKP